MYAALFLITDKGQILIASCSQDMFIRVWRLSHEVAKEPTSDQDLKVKKDSFLVTTDG